MLLLVSCMLWGSRPSVLFSPGNFMITSICMDLAIAERRLYGVTQKSNFAMLPPLFSLPQVTTEWGNSKHQFTYDAVFGEDGQESSLLYPKCVAALVEGLFKGYNATVFACECCCTPALNYLAEHGGLGRWAFVSVADAMSLLV